MMFLLFFPKYLQLHRNMGLKKHTEILLLATNLKPRHGQDYNHSDLLFSISFASRRSTLFDTKPSKHNTKEIGRLSLYCEQKKILDQKEKDESFFQNPDL
ncbi:hypothetical protein Dsin_029501 [Dipteronia sinensis]|uniref:Uncharacterized protein n=1 Tax=Dipteronia sinensis TaxID=43782 RepID=A0AAE0DVF5_9ROSI|nr:hypothetical protein Dsin_029501 [Dipteronia sinensis]